MRQIDSDLFFVAYRPRTFKCSTPLHCNVFTLDNSKFLVLNFVYNGIYKAVDERRIMIIYCDTDYVTFAIAGNKTKGLNQGFEDIIVDSEFWNKNRNDMLTDEKKLLHFATENIGDEMIALAPKNYILHRVKEYKKAEDIPKTQNDAWMRDKNGDFIMDYKKGLKGVNKDNNKHINFEAFQKCLLEGKITAGKNCTFQPRKNMEAKEKGDRADYTLSKITVNKFALSGIYTKGVVLENTRCCPFIQGLTADNYVVH
ncbi:hypothetical protein FACS189472_11240 [Alphaproteobacteria bacterium]|nr:hypothetical protein FACS189472_11240 [Alphaproteobacteria bacterium]